MSQGTGSFQVPSDRSNDVDAPARLPPQTPQRQKHGSKQSRRQGPNALSDYQHQENNPHTIQVCDGTKKVDGSPWKERTAIG
jgi:hypothetical protein